MADYSDMRHGSASRVQHKVPGGTAKKLDTDNWETPIQTAVREAWEEPKVTLTEGDLESVLDLPVGPDHFQAFYLAVSWGVIPLIADNHHGDDDEYMTFRWAPVQEMINNLTVKHLKGFTAGLEKLLYRLSRLVLAKKAVEPELSCEYIELADLFLRLMPVVGLANHRIKSIEERQQNQGQPGRYETKQVIYDPRRDPQYRRQRSRR